MIIARSFDVVVNGIISFFPDGWGISHCIYVPHLVYPLICPQAFTLVLFLITFLLQHLLFPPLGWNQLGYSSEISDLKLMSRRGVGQRGGGGGMENSKWVGLQPSNLVSPISRGHIKWLAICEPRSQLSPDTKSARTLITGSPASRTTRKRYVLFRSHLIYGVLLEWPKRIKTSPNSRSLT